MPVPQNEYEKLYSELSAIRQELLIIQDELENLLVASLLSPKHLFLRNSLTETLEILIARVELYTNELTYLVSGHNAPGW